MLDAVIDEIDGRMIRVGNRWLADFASCNYLGFDLDREIIEAVPAYLDAWGTHPSWSRLLGSPVLYEQIEAQLTELLGAPDSLVLPTITHIHTSVIPILAGSGTILLDGRAHKTIYDGCQIARSHGATIRRFAFEDPGDLERLLRDGCAEPRIICMDGVNSMTGNAPDLPAFARVAREYDALLERAKVRPAGLLEASSLEAVKRCVEVGLGVAIVPAIAVERELELGVLRELPMAKPAMEFGFCLAWRKGEEPPPPVLMLLERLRAAPGYLAVPMGYLNA